MCSLLWAQTNSQTRFFDNEHSPHGEGLCEYQSLMCIITLLWYSIVEAVSYPRHPTRVRSLLFSKYLNTWRHNPNRPEGAIHSILCNRLLLHIRKAASTEQHSTPGYSRDMNRLSTPQFAIQRTRSESLLSSLTSDSTDSFENDVFREIDAKNSFEETRGEDSQSTLVGVQGKPSLSRFHHASLRTFLLREWLPAALAYRLEVDEVDCPGNLA